MNESEKDRYIEYLEARLEKITENHSVGKADLDTLIDTQNLLALHSSFSLKDILSKNEELAKQADLLQRKSEIADEFVEYLTNSVWWKMSRPFRVLTRRMRNRRQYSAFVFSEKSKIKDAVAAIVYARDENGLEKQIKNIQKQTGLTKIEIIIVDLINSGEIAKVAEARKVRYVNLLDGGGDSILSARKILTEEARYVVSIGQNVAPNDERWIYKMIKPLSDKYTRLSVLFDRRVAKGIINVKKETFFEELKARIVSIDYCDCLFLPESRDGVQYIPFSIMNEASAVAKACGE